MTAPEIFEFNTQSLLHLEDCHPDLQEIAYELIREMNVTILCGHRNEKDQNSAFIDGKSKLQWPNSKHNMLPSHAMDIAPYPVNWNNLQRFDEMLDMIELIAQRLNIKIRLGRDFSFKDYPHIELVFVDKRKA